MMQGGAVASRGGKRVPKSAAYVKSVPPSERRKKRQSSSAASQRVPIQPPVCGVQPGKALELRTSLGIIRAKEMIEQQQVEQQRVEEAADDLSLLQKVAITRGQLKHGRLQPLGVVNDTAFLPAECLGVIPVSPKTKTHSRQQRPRSSTAPGIHFDLPHPHSSEHHYERVGTKVNIKRRSYSAVLTRQLKTEQLLHLLSISKNTGLVPSPPNISETSNVGDNLPQEESLPSTISKTDSPSAAGVLPPVVHHGELGMTIEVKRLRKEKPSESPPNAPSKSPTHVGQKTVESSTENLPKLPQIPSKQEESLPSPKTSPSSKSTAEDNAVRHSTPPSSSTSPMRVSIVSIGEAKKVESRSKLVKRKNHTGGIQSGGRLSLGWSPPQSIEPLKGSPMNTPTKKANASQVNGLSDGAVSLDNECRPSTPGLTITVDVNEFLQDPDES